MGNMCRNYEDKEIEIKIEKDSPINEFKEVEDYKETVKKMNVFKRSQIAKELYNKFSIEHNYIDISIIQGKEEIKNYYIKIKCLTLIDNTNKDIIKLYLKFLKSKDSWIIENNLHSFNKEIRKYKILYSVEEMKEIDDNVKLISEKENLIEYLTYISNIDSEEEYLNVFENAKQRFSSLYLFNIPIEFNNSELFYYKFYYSILYEIINNKKNDDKINKRYIETKKCVIKYVLDNCAFSNKEIIKNEDKINLLMLYILKEYDNEFTNFNRLFQKVPVTKEDFLKFKEKTKYINNLVNNDKYICHKILNDYINIPLQKVCLNNLNNKAFQEEYNIRSYFNVDALLRENEIIQFIPNIKQFLIKIVDSNVYKEAIKKLFPNYSEYLLQNDNEEIKFYINKRIKFYPFENINISGITDKLGCYTYLTTINFIGAKLVNSQTYKVGLTVVNGFHEISHTNQNLIFYKGNDTKLLNTPEREGLGKEGGNSLEYLLFGKLIQDIDLFQSLYILNENNYKQSLEKFKENFENIHKIVKETDGKSKLINIEDGIFKEFFNKNDIAHFIGKLNDSNYVMPTMFIGKMNKNVNKYKNITKCGIIGGWKKFD